MIVWIFLAFVVMTGVQVYNFSPRTCDPGRDGDACMRPLYTQDNLVDLHMFVSQHSDPFLPSRKELKESSPQALRHLGSVLNTTLAQAKLLAVQVPLPRGFRSASSPPVLWLHVLLTRVGQPCPVSPALPALFAAPPLLQNKKQVEANETDQAVNETAVGRWQLQLSERTEAAHADRTLYRLQPAPGQQQPPWDVLFASSPLTRYMKPLARNRTLLLGGKEQDSASKSPDSSSSNSSSGLAGSGGKVDWQGVAQDWSDYLETHNGWLCLLLAGFGLCLLGLCRASLPLALVRYALLLAAAHAGLQLYREIVLAAALQPAATPVRVADVPHAAHWKPRVRLRFVRDHRSYPLREPPNLHLLLQPNSEFVMASYPTARLQDAPAGRLRHVYKPGFYVEDFMFLHRHWMPLSSAADHPDPTFTLDFAPQGRVFFQVIRSFDEAMKVYSGVLEPQDVDEVKFLFSEDRLYVLALTYVISMLHMLFDFLAFKNDIGFFASRTDFVGLSYRSIFSNFVCNLIIFLYLCDNEYTSKLVLLSVGTSVLVEGWKMSRLLKAGLQWRYGLPWVRWADATTSQTAGEKVTEEIDAKGLRLLGYMLYPIMGAWAFYSLLYHPHKSWRSWLLHSLANGVYTFGFIAMTPQLFVNYKLKSVDHLPWRVFMYKAFNTFIDDVFSVMIQMPMSHRIACLRDDVVFFIYLYQRWCYPVDKTRPNQYGRVYKRKAPAPSVENTHPASWLGSEPVAWSRGPGEVHPSCLPTPNAALLMASAAADSSNSKEQHSVSSNEQDSNSNSGEQDVTLWTGNALLYRWQPAAAHAAGGEWQAVGGVGTLRFMRHCTRPRTRLVWHERGNMRLGLETYPSMESGLTQQAGQPGTRSWIGTNYATHPKDLVKLAVKFKGEALAQDFEAHFITAAELNASLSVHVASAAESRAAIDRARAVLQDHQANSEEEDEEDDESDTTDTSEDMLRKRALGTRSRWEWWGHSREHGKHKTKYAPLFELARPPRSSL
eukprot:g83336.t1